MVGKKDLDYWIQNSEAKIIRKTKVLII